MYLLVLAALRQLPSCAIRLKTSKKCANRGFFKKFGNNNSAFWPILIFHGNLKSQHINLVRMSKIRSISSKWIHLWCLQCNWGVIDSILFGFHRYWRQICSRFEIMKIAIRQSQKINSRIAIRQRIAQLGPALRHFSKWVNCQLADNSLTWPQDMQCEIKRHDWVHLGVNFRILVGRCPLH